MRLDKLTQKSQEALQEAQTRAVSDARRVFFGSILYLPLLWILMIAGRT